ncbi:hypothetical protein C0995_005506 [Termitomyces sp. Mi166|nr:hypothetical protein C0995_005506 [Termitomyces sp. Mi166\
MPRRPPLTIPSSQEHTVSTTVASSDASEGASPSISPSLSRSKPLFHIPHDGTDTEDSSSPRLIGSPERFPEDSSWSEPDDPRQSSHKTKDDIRKYHALKELLDTEVGYLLDLRALVTVYLRILPTLVCRPPPSTTFGRASQSFASSPWVNSHSYTAAAAAAASASASAISDSYAVSSLSSSQSKDLQKTTQRYLFTNLEVEILTRNAEEILQLHEQFLRELRKEITPLGFHLEAYKRSGDPAKTLNLAMQNTDAAIRIISSKFATEVHEFSRHFFPPVKILIVSRLPFTTPSYDHDASRPAKDRSRAASMSSLEGAVRTLRSRASIHGRESVTPPAESTAGRKEKTTPRLAFLDYMIKPVQRICKYPLILDQLRSGKSVRSSSMSDVDVVVESAQQAMKHVASAVDEARHRQDVAMRSALIASRITLGSPSMSSLYPTFKALSQPFLSSLGTCLLAGSLDVIHYSGKPSGSNVVVKYMGAFLYLGGYLILVKVSKSKVYEPRHWFSLADFDIIDVDETDGMLPYAIRISSKEHRFEMAAACQREKDAWLRSIRESRNHKPQWINEPTPSLRFDGKGDLIPSALDDGPFELVNVLPTIQSIPELAGNTDYLGLADTLMMAFGSDTKRKPSKQDLLLKQESDPLSRRSSTASVKGIFAPLSSSSSDSEMIVIRRYSTSARTRVDQGLQDIISQLCLTARSYATLKDEELFPSPKVTRGGFVRSQSGLSISGMAAKSRLNRHESVHVLRRRSLIEWPDGLSSKKSSISSNQSSTRRPSTGPSHAGTSDSDAPRSSSPHSHSAPSPSASLLSSSHACSSPKSSVRSSSILFSSTTVKPRATTTSEPRTPMKTSRSLVSGVKELLFSPSRSSLGQSESLDTTDSYGSKKRTVGSLRRWAKSSIHRRTRSAPEEEKFTLPDIQKLPALSIPSFELPGLEFGSTIPLSGSPNPYDPSQTQECLPAEKLPLRPILVSSGRCQQPSVEVPPKHLSILQRLKA